MVDGLFVYGTLRVSGSLHHLIRELVDSAEPGYTIAGTLYDLGEYPGLIIGKGAAVRGELLRSTRLEELLARTDEIEGEWFRRRLAWAHREGDPRPPVLVWVYEWVGGHSRGPSGRNSTERQT